MAFWGVELKPGKPFTHCCEKSKGRLRISQATLGIGPTGNDTQKAVVQCNVGNRRPVLLCALLPNKIESCHLDLEFEEADDVVFSFLGPRSVYLTGYYLQKNHQSNHQSDTESHGVDIENTQTEGSSFCSDDDKYDDSFIDDVELQVSPLAPGISLKVDDTALEKDTPNDRKHSCKRLTERNQEIQSDGEETHKTEDVHVCLLSVLKSRKCLETTMSDDAENVAQVLVELGEKAEDSGNCGSKPYEKVDHDNSCKPESTKPKRKRRKRFLQEEKSCEFEIDNDQSILRVKTVQEVESSIDLTENSQETKERSEELPKETSAEEVGGICDNTPKDTESNVLFDCSTTKILLTSNGERQEQAMDNQPKKKIKKKGKKKAQGEGDMDTMKMVSAQENMFMTCEDPQIENVMQVKKSALSNGLIIEALAQGPSDGKIATVGKKIKLFYTAMLKESGKVFDSNVGGTACSCRLGDEEFIDGWNIGIEGMRIGDKRRLIIPPSMGFGSRGVGENVPPNSWLVYDIELVNVRS